MATGHRSHCVRVCLIQLHWPRESGILIPPSQSTSGPFAPRVHFTFCQRESQGRKQEEDTAYQATILRDCHTGPNMRLLSSAALSIITPHRRPWACPQPYLSP